MEAMAAGVPVVASNVGGTSELVADGVNGFLVPPGAPEALARRIRQLLDDPDLRTRLGRAGQDTVAGAFDVGRQTARLRRLFEAAIRATPQRPSPGDVERRNKSGRVSSMAEGSVRALETGAHWREDRRTRQRT